MPGFKESPAMFSRQQNWRLPPGRHSDTFSSFHSVSKHQKLKVLFVHRPEVCERGERRLSMVPGTRSVCVWAAPYERAMR